MAETIEPELIGTGTEAVAEDQAQRTFSVSILVSAVRCLLTYVLIPVVAPFLGWASGVGPVLGLIIGVVAIGANLMSIRRFHRADHRWKWHMTVLNVSVIILLSILLVIDIGDLSSSA